MAKTPLRKMWAPWRVPVTLLSRALVGGRALRVADSVAGRGEMRPWEQRHRGVGEAVGAANETEEGWPKKWKSRK